jgi:cell division protein ZapB
MAASETASMTSADSLPEPTRSELQQLSLRIAQLIQMARRLEDENRVLKSEAAQLSAERTLLFDRNQQARSRIESMITRLKALEASV